MNHLLVALWAQLAVELRQQRDHAQGQRVAFARDEAVQILSQKRADRCACRLHLLQQRGGETRLTVSGTQYCQQTNDTRQVGCGYRAVVHSQVQQCALRLLLQRRLTDLRHDPAAQFLQCGTEFAVQRGTPGKGRMRDLCDHLRRDGLSAGSRRVDGVCEVVRWLRDHDWVKEAHNELEGHRVGDAAPRGGEKFTIEAIAFCLVQCCSHMGEKGKEGEANSVERAAEESCVIHERNDGVNDEGHRGRGVADEGRGGRQHEGEEERADVRIALCKSAAVEQLHPRGSQLQEVHSLHSG